jgi:hypothetical protein
MITGQPKFTGLVIGEVTIDKMSPTVKIKAKAAFVDVATGATYGWTTAEGALWSKETREKLAELLLSMESDIANVHFESGGTPEGSPIETVTKGPPAGGLGEHIGTDAPSV